MSIAYLPVWKKNATAAERLSEVEAIARVHPDRFASMILIYESAEDSDGCTTVRYACSGLDTNQILGLLEQAKEEVHVQTRRKRVR